MNCNRGQDRYRDNSINAWDQSLSTCNLIPIIAVLVIKVNILMTKPIIIEWNNKTIHTSNNTIWRN